MTAAGGRDDAPPVAIDDFRFLLDEDLSPGIARVGRGLGLDVLSVHELGRTGLHDEQQLRWAAAEGRILVTRNRDDFIEWTVAFFQRGEPHAGVLIVTTSISILGAERVVHALRRSAAERAGGEPLPAYFIDFLAEQAG